MVRIISHPFVLPGRPFCEPNCESLDTTSELSVQSARRNEPEDDSQVLCSV